MTKHNPEYDDEAGMADNNLETLRRAVDGIDHVINAGDNLPEWCQEKIAVAKSMLVTVWDYMRSEEERGVTETKKSHKRPKYSIKPRGAVLPAYQPGGDPKKKKKRNGYFEELESRLSSSLNEYQDRMAGVGMGNYVVDKSPTEAIKPKTPVKCFRQGDEWVVQIKGTIVRIPTDEASSSEEAIAQAKTNLGMSEARTMSPGLKAAQKNLSGLASGEIQRQEKQRKGAEKAQRQATKNLDRMLNRKPAKKSKQDLQTLWAKIESVIANSFPDGDPYDQLWPYMQKNGFTQDDVERASKMNGYKDLWDYWNTLTQDIENDAYGDWLATGGKNVRTRGQFMETQSSTWTHDILAAKLFEQELTYEDRLSGMLNRKLKK